MSGSFAFLAEGATFSGDDSLGGSRDELKVSSERIELYQLCLEK